ncbi:hypothetical protein JRO89_XS10G0104300 [Xanthoceras sorbifolium]|uniref:Retrotransposon gag domain-containing protein n=1 Tax=Xanthoceras sorbifolium TaxID=99658 RepID=A0ABQ8HI94_9ROSI|nr:hypothetical protein JRO89_XS10G0104300 [Xanthoceras sorbifolium]
MIGERLGRMEADNVGQQQPIHRWVFPCEQYQRVTVLTEAELLYLATVHLEGDAVPWYQWLEHSMGQMTWEQFKRALQTRFGSLEEANVGGTLTKLRQTGTIKEYRLQFERLANRIRDLLESFLISCFLSGLRDDIKVGVQLLKPVSLLQAFELARFQEELISVANRKMNYHPTFTRSSSTLPGPSQLALTSTTYTSSTPSLLGPVPSGLPLYHRLSVAEQVERRTKGLCFNCDEKFKLGHRCKTPQLLLLEANAAKDAELANESEDASPIVEISLKALTGLSPQNTMRLKGSIKKYSVTILVDSGSTHNFLNPTLAKQCGCKVTSTDQFELQ